MSIIASATISFKVRGVPIPQGSMRAFVVKGRPIITSANRSLKAWRDIVASEAQRHAPPSVFLGPVKVRLFFHLPRPKTLPKKVVHAIKRPDLDKLCRVLDSLTGVIWKDDSQVVKIEADKWYETVLNPPGVEIEIISLDGGVAPDGELSKSS